MYTTSRSKILCWAWRAPESPNSFLHPRRILRRVKGRNESSNIKYKENKRREDKEILYIQSTNENKTNIYVKRLEERLKQLPCFGGETIQEEWDICKSTIQQVAEEVLGRQIS
jgi:hypothetical protein